MKIHKAKRKSLKFYTKNSAIKKLQGTFYVWKRKSLIQLFDEFSRGNEHISKNANKAILNQKTWLCLKSLLAEARLNMAWDSIRSRIHVEQVKKHFNCHLFALSSIARRYFPLRRNLGLVEQKIIKLIEDKINRNTMPYEGRSFRWNLCCGRENCFEFDMIYISVFCRCLLKAYWNSNKILVVKTSLK